MPEYPCGRFRVASSLVHRSRISLALIHDGAPLLLAPLHVFLFGHGRKLSSRQLPAKLPFPVITPFIIVHFFSAFSSSYSICIYTQSPDPSRTCLPSFPFLSCFPVSAFYSFLPSISFSVGPPFFFKFPSRPFQTRNRSSYIILPCPVFTILAGLFISIPLFALLI